MVRTTAANVADGTMLIELIDAIPPIAGKIGAPRRLPEAVIADKAYHSQARELLLLQRGITPMLPRRGRPHPPGLGRLRWVVERTISWLHQHRRLRVRYERRADIHQAFLTLACIRICFRMLPTPLC